MSQECSICFSEIGKRHFKCPNGHKFHTGCIRKWITKSGGTRGTTCPVCRVSLVSRVNPPRYYIKFLAVFEKILKATDNAQEVLSGMPDGEDLTKICILGKSVDACVTFGIFIIYLKSFYIKNKKKYITNAETYEFRIRSFQKDC